MNRILILLVILTVFSCTEKKSNSGNDNPDNKTGKIKLTEFKELYFVGLYSGLPSIYRYDNEIEKSKIFWSHKDERVLELLVSPDRKVAYFITKRKQRLKSSKPAIERGQLYRIDFSTKKVESITQLEDGIQILPFWTDNDRFMLVINSIDKTIASYINKNTQVYNQFGKLLSDNNETFDLTKDGYPVTKLPSFEYNSHDNLFNILEKQDSVFIRQSDKGNIYKFKLGENILKQIGWAENNKYVILLLMNNNKLQKNSEINSTLIVFNLQKRKIVKTFEGIGYRRFVLIGDLLIFDDGFGKDSFIEVFSLDKLTENKRIKINGGCGLKNIPGL